MPADVENWNKNGDQSLKAAEGARNDAAGSVDMKLTAALVSEFQQRGAVFWFGNLTVSKITVVK